MEATGASDARGGVGEGRDSELRLGKRETNTVQAYKRGEEIDSESDFNPIRVL